MCVVLRVRAKARRDSSARGEPVVWRAPVDVSVKSVCFFLSVDAGGANLPASGEPRLPIRHVSRRARSCLANLARTRAHMDSTRPPSPTVRPSARRPRPAASPDAKQPVRPGRRHLRVGSNATERRAQPSRGACSEQRARAAQTGPAGKPARAAEQRGRRRPSPDMLYVRRGARARGQQACYGQGPRGFAVRGVQLGRTWALRARCADNQGCAREVSSL